MGLLTQWKVIYIRVSFHGSLEFIDLLIWRPDKLKTQYRTSLSKYQNMSPLSNMKSQWYKPILGQHGDNLICAIQFRSFNLSCCMDKQKKLWEYLRYLDLQVMPKRLGVLSFKSYALIVCWISCWFFWLQFYFYIDLCIPGWLSIVYAWTQTYCNPLKGYGHILYAVNWYF